MNDIRRTILWVIFGFSLVLLWDQWQLHNGNVFPQTGSGIVGPGQQRPGQQRQCPAIGLCHRDGLARPGAFIGSQRIGHGA